MCSRFPPWPVPRPNPACASVTISNLPAARYVLRFGDVPYYQTPADRTNTLTAGGTVNFTGNYTFFDVNTNGISDSWDGITSLLLDNRTQLTDTAGDGMTDYAEFYSPARPEQCKFGFGVDAARGAAERGFAGSTGRRFRAAPIGWTPAPIWSLDATSDWIPAPRRQPRRWFCRPKRRRELFLSVGVRP